MKIGCALQVSKIILNPFWSPWLWVWLVPLCQVPTKVEEQGCQHFTSLPYLHLMLSISTSGKHVCMVCRQVCWTWWTAHFDLANEFVKEIQRETTKTTQTTSTKLRNRKSFELKTWWMYEVFSQWRNPNDITYHRPIFFLVKTLIGALEICTSKEFASTC